MINLSAARDVQTLDLDHGVTVTVRPFSTSILFAARAEMRRIIGGITKDLPDDVVVPQSDIEASFVKGAGIAGITAWDGIGNEAGEPIDVSAAAVEALLDIAAFGSKFHELYVSPGLTVVAEKNG